MTKKNNENNEYNEMSKMVDGAIMGGMFIAKEMYKGYRQKKDVEKYIDSRYKEKYESIDLNNKYEIKRVLREMKSEYGSFDVYYKRKLEKQIDLLEKIENISQEYNIKNFKDENELENVIQQIDKKIKNSLNEESLREERKNKKIIVEKLEDLRKLKAEERKSLEKRYGNINLNDINTVITKLYILKGEIDRNEYKTSEAEIYRDKLQTALDKRKIALKKEENEIRILDSKYADINFDCEKKVRDALCSIENEINGNIYTSKKSKEEAERYKEKFENALNEKELTFLDTEYGSISLSNQKKVRDAFYKIKAELDSKKYISEKSKQKAESYRDKFENLLKQYEKIILEETNYDYILRNERLDDLKSKEHIEEAIIELEEGINLGTYITQEAKNYLKDLKLKLAKIEEYEQNINTKNKHVKNKRKNINSEYDKEDNKSIFVEKSIKNNNVKLNEIKNKDTNKRNKPSIIGRILYFILFYFGIVGISLAIDEKDISNIPIACIILGIGLLVRNISMRKVDIEYYKQLKQSKKASTIGIMIRLFIGVIFIWMGIDINTSMYIIIGSIIILYVIKSIKNRIKCNKNKL